MKRGSMLLLILIASLFVNGCWNRRELNEIGIIIATAIDKGDDHMWEVSFQVVIPPSIATQAGGGGGGQAPVTVFSTRGRTLEEAFQNANTETPRILFLSHTRVIIISEKVAREGVGPIIDFYLRQADNRETADVLLTKGDARKMLEVLIPLEKIPGNAMDRLIMVGDTNLSFVQRIKLHDFISDMTTPPINAILPEIRISGEPSEQNSLEAVQKTRSTAVIKLGDMGIFKKDKLLGWLNRKESTGLAWMSDEVRQAVVVFPCPGNGAMQSSFGVERSSTKRTVHEKNGKLSFGVEIKAEGSLSETACKLDMSKPESITKLEKQIEGQIKKDAEAAFIKTQTMKADPYGFGDLFHKKYPRKWKSLSGKWEEAISDADLNVKVHVSMRRTGLTNDAFTKLLKK